MSQIVRNMSIIALGANIDGAWGTPDQTLRKCVKCLAGQGFSEIQVSQVYRTKAYGSVRQPDYLNCVVHARCAVSPRQAIEVFKRNERCSGRRLLGRNAPRPLDIDLLDFGGRVVNWRVGYPRPKLVLPHPLLANRAFVLVPLAALLPRWRHPVYELTAHQLLNRQGGLRQIMLRREIFPIDLDAVSCE